VEVQAHLEFQVIRDRQENKEILECLVLKDQGEDPDQLVHWGLWANLAQEVLQEDLEKLENLANLVNPELLVQWENKGRKDRWAELERLDLKVYPACLVNLALLVHLVHRDLLEKL
jgi:hypothetical protein